MSLITLTNPQSVNSTTYADLLGVMLGLPRLPRENSQDYFARLSKAGHCDRTHDYMGVIDEINLELGLKTYKAISIYGQEANVIVTIAGVVIKDPAGIIPDVTSPLMNLDVDGIWTWRMMSEIVDDIKASGTYQAALIGEDAPAIQLAKQDNVLTSLAQPLNGQHFNLGRTGIILGSELFSVPVPPYELHTDGILQFSQVVPTGTQITYQYRVWPYYLVASEAAVLGLMEPDIAKVALTPSNTLVYQIQEYIQAIMRQDLSYWGK